MLASTTTYHASDGTAYERFLGRWTTVLATPLLDFAEFPPVGPLLDVGTGTGSLAVAMTARWRHGQPLRQAGGVRTRPDPADQTSRGCGHSGITAVPAHRFAAWVKYSDGMSVRLPCRRAALDEWWGSVAGGVNERRGACFCAFVK
jgi:hypothetical protein